MLERILLWLPSASSVRPISGRIQSSAAAQPPVFGLAAMAAAQEGTRSTAALSSLGKGSSSAAEAPVDGGSGGGPFGMKTGAAARTCLSMILFVVLSTCYMLLSIETTHHTQ